MSDATFYHDNGQLRLKIEDRSQIPGAISRLQAMGGSATLRIPVLQAIYRGEIGSIDVDANTTSRWIKTFLSACRLPALVVIADDVEQPAGPGGIAQIARLMQWARQIIIHGTGGQIHHYEAAVLSARQVRRTLLVECPSCLIAEWQAAARRWAKTPDVLTIQPRPGDFHPDASLRGPVQ